MVTGLSALFTYLVDKIVTDNGAGHKELEDRVATGEVSEEEKRLILLKASAKMLSSKVNQVCEKIAS